MERFKHHATVFVWSASSKKNAMKIKSIQLQHFSIIASLLLCFSYSSDGLCQAGINGGKPIITFNTTGPLSIKTQSPPDFPGGEDKLSEFILRRVDEIENSIKLPRKLWLTASIDPTGKVTSLSPTYDNDPTLKKEMDRVGSIMPRWNPGKINEEGVETKFQFLIRRRASF